MAKTQTFVNKSNKKGASDQISVKIVMMNKSEKGTYKFNERFIKVKDLAEVEKVARG
jgi:hypothetical protein